MTKGGAGGLDGRVPGFGVVASLRAFWEGVSCPSKGAIPQMSSDANLRD